MLIRQIWERLGKNQTPSLKVSRDISAQWLIGRFVRVLHSKSDLYEWSELSSPYLQPPKVSQTFGAVRGREDELFLSVEFFPAPSFARFSLSGHICTWRGWNARQKHSPVTWIAALYGIFRSKGWWFGFCGRRWGSSCRSCLGTAYPWLWLCIVV